MYYRRSSFATDSASSISNNSFCKHGKYNESLILFLAFAGILVRSVVLGNEFTEEGTLKLSNFDWKVRLFIGWNYEAGYRSKCDSLGSISSTWESLRELFRVFGLLLDLEEWWIEAVKDKNDYQLCRDEISWEECWVLGMFMDTRVRICFTYSVFKIFILLLQAKLYSEIIPTILSQYFWAHIRIQSSLETKNVFKILNFGTQTIWPP